MKRYGARQWGLAAAVAAIFVLLAVVAFPPYYSVVSPFGGMQTVHGTSEPFNGTWTLVLAIAAGLASVVGALAAMPAQNRRLAFGAAALLYVVAAVLALTDVTRDMPTMTGPGFSMSKGLGPVSALMMSLLGAIAAGMAAKETSPGTTSPPSS
jgi:hypothetical protein